MFLAYCVDYALSCSCSRTSLEESFCNKYPKHFIYRGKATNKKLVDDIPPSLWKGKAIYDVLVLEVFKKPEGSDVSAGSVIQLTTSASGSLCGSFLRLETETLITGNGNHFGLCDFKATYSSLTESEIQGLNGGYICN